MRMDGQTDMTKLIVPFRHYVNTSKFRTKPVRVVSKVVEVPTVFVSHTFLYLYGSTDCLDQWYIMQLMEVHAAHLREVRNVQINHFS